MFLMNTSMAWTNNQPKSIQSTRGKFLVRGSQKTKVRDTSLDFPHGHLLGSKENLKQLDSTNCMASKTSLGYIRTVLCVQPGVTVRASRKEETRFY
jgi:hypothetical protein